MLLRAVVDNDLRAWHTHLRDVVYPQVYLPEWRMRDQNNVLWLYRHTAFVHQRQNEAVELLAHLALADWKLCRKHMLEIWGGNDFESNDTRYDTPANEFNLVTRFSIELEAVLNRGPFPLGLQLYFTTKNDHTTNISVLCEGIVTRDHATSPSEDYQKLSTMIAELATVNASLPPQLLYVPVCLQQAEHNGKEDTTRALFEAVQIAASQSHFRRQEPSSTSIPGPRLLIDRIEFDRDVFEFDDITQFKYLDLLRREGVRCVYVPELNFATTPPAEYYMNKLQEMFATDGTNSQAIGTESQFMATIIDDIPIIFSAIYASTTLRELRIHLAYRDGGPEDDMNYFWLWFTLGVFQGRAPIRRLEISVEEIDDEGIDGLRQAFAHQHLLYEMIKSKTHESTRSEPRFIDASSFSITDEPSLEQLITSDHIQRGLPVAHQSGDWLRVLLPGWGPAWVHQDAATESANQSELSQVSSGSLIEQLVLTYVNEDTADLTLELIELIGRDVRQLEVISRGRQRNLEGSAWLTRMFPMCTQLEDLRLHAVDFENFSTLVDCYASGVCRVKRLTVQCVDSTMELEAALFAVLLALRNDQHPISQFLEELTCYCTSYEQVGHTTVLNAALAMLNANTNLRALSFEFPEMRLPSRLRHHYRAMFAEHDGTPLPRRSGPLAMKRKIAFLSVTAALEGAAQSLDSAVISSVFEFAARCEKRRVALRIPSDDQ